MIAEKHIVSEVSLMKIRTLVFAMVLTAGIAAAALAQPYPSPTGSGCGNGAIYITTLDNSAVHDMDKYWGNPKDFGRVASYILAYKLMWITGKPVIVLDKPTDELMTSDGSPNVEKAKELQGDMPASCIVLGQITSAVIETKRVFKPGESRKKYRISVKVRLVLIDAKTGEVKLDAPYSEYHETSLLEQENINNADKRPGFSMDPVEAGGSALGVPFSRIFGRFARSIAAMPQAAD